MRHVVAAMVVSRLAEPGRADNQRAAPAAGRDPAEAVRRPRIAAWSALWKATHAGR